MARCMVCERQFESGDCPLCLADRIKELRALLEEARPYVASCVNDMPGNHARGFYPRLLKALKR